MSQTQTIAAIEILIAQHRTAAEAHEAAVRAHEFDHDAYGDMVRPNGFAWNETTTAIEATRAVDPTLMASGWEEACDIPSTPISSQSAANLHRHAAKAHWAAAKDLRDQITAAAKLACAACEGCDAAPICSRSAIEDGTPAEAQPTRRGIVVSLTEDQLQLLLDHLSGYEGVRMAMVPAGLGEDLDADLMDADRTWTSADPIDQLAAVMTHGDLEEVTRG